VIVHVQVKKITKHDKEHENVIIETVKNLGITVNV